MPDVHVSRQGPPHSVEIIITDAEKHTDDPRWKELQAYDHIARRLLADVLALKERHEAGALTKPRNWDKERSEYERVIKRLKEAAAELAKDNERLEEQLALAEEKQVEMHARINELTINLGHATEKLKGLGLMKEKAAQTGYSFMELMDEDSRRAWETLMKEIPRP